MIFLAKLVKRTRARAREARLRLEGDEVSQIAINYGSITRDTPNRYMEDMHNEPLDNALIEANYHSEHPRWFL